MAPAERPEITIGIPAYNEVECLESVVRHTREVLLKLSESFEILLVDDGSTDGTAALADRLAAQWSELRVIHHPENLSFSGVMRTIYRSVRGRWLFLIPADGQVDVAEIAAFLPHRAQADVVLGYRLTKPDAWHRRVNHVLFWLLTRMLFGFRFREISSCKLYRADLVNDLPLLSRPGTATVEPEVLFRLLRRGARFAEVPYHLLPRQGGTAKGARIPMILKTFADLFWLRIRLIGRDG